MNYECLICQVNALKQRLVKYGIPEENRGDLVSEILVEIANGHHKNSYSPEVTRNIIDKLIAASGVNDVYIDEKNFSNQQMTARYSGFKTQVENSTNPFNTALRLAIAGNIIDYGPTNHFDVDATIERVFHTDFEIDHSQLLESEISKAKSILYLADNCGEIVLDKLFLETIGHPNVFVAVRGKPVLNDATEKEALEVGINEVATIISNGDDAPSTLLHRVSSEFMEIYQSADLIISKGMGNYEGLMDETDPRIFFLLMVKCPEIGKKIGASNGSFIVKHNS